MIYGGRLLLLALLSAGCSPERVELLLDLDTDLVPGVELSRVRTERFDHLPRTEERAEPAHTRERKAERGEVWDEPIRIAELSGLAPGRHYVRVRLLTQSDVPVLQRIAVLTVRETSIFTLTMTRDCRGVTCPAAGDDPTALACIGGRCGDPSCTDETPDACPPPACGTDADCTIAAACASARCSAGTCLAVPDDTECAATEWCSPEDGCLGETRVVTSSPGGQVDPWDLVVTDGGNAAIVGAVAGAVDFGDGPFPAPASTGWMVAEVGPDLAVHWSHIYAASDVTDGRSIALLPEGGTIASGLFTGDGTFGTTMLSAGAEQDVLLLGHDAAGALTLAQPYPSAGENAQGRGIATRGDGAIAITGAYGSDLVVGGVALPTVSGAVDWAFAAVVEPPSTAVWAVHFSADTNAIADDIVFLSDGGVCVVGRFDDDVAAGGETRIGRGDWDGFVSRIDPAGNVLWLRSFGGPGNDSPQEALAAGDGCIVVGHLSPGASFDDVDPETFGDLDGFVARYDAAGGVEWVRVIGGPGTDFLWSVVAGPGESAIVAGAFRDAIEITGGDALVATGSDGIVAGIERDGSVAWARSFGGDGDERVSALGFDPGPSRVAIATRFRGHTRVGRFETTAVGASDAWLHWFTP